jgi:Ca2+-binding EF-hand superfamily protein
MADALRADLGLETASNGSGEKRRPSDASTAYVSTLRSPGLSERPSYQDWADDYPTGTQDYGEEDVLMPCGSACPGVDIEFAATVEEALARFTDDLFTDNERTRMRLAFIRFSDVETAEVGRDRLHDVLVHLGYFTSTEIQAKVVAKQVSEYSTFDFQDFQEFVARFVRFEHAALSEKAEAFVRSGTENHTVSGLLEFFRNLGVIASQELIPEVLKMAGLYLDPETGDIALGLLDCQGVLRVLAAYRCTEGFTRYEIEKAKETFEKLERLPPCRRCAQTGCPVKACELTNGLCEFLGAYYIDHLTNMSEKMQDSEDAPGLSCHEFLVWARRLRDLGMEELFLAYEAARVAGKGRVGVDDVITTVVELGFTLLKDAILEVLEETGLRLDEAVDFPKFMRFVEVCRRTHGFTFAETQEFLDTYSRFDYDGNNELETMEVLDMLRSMGHTTGLDDAHGLIKQVDFNKNGTMDRSEYMRLMRLTREKLLASTLVTYDQCREGHDALPVTKIEKAFALQGLHPSSDVIEELLQPHKDSMTISYENFVSLVYHCQEAAAVESRKRAGFSDATFQVLQLIFRTCDKKRTGCISLGELIWLLKESNVPVHTLEHRGYVFKSLDIARGRAIETGVPLDEVGSMGDNPCRFWDFVHLVRILIRNNEEAAESREQEVVLKTKFSPAEVTQFRQCFNVMVHELRGESEKRRRRIDMTLSKSAGDKPASPMSRAGNGGNQNVGPPPGLSELMNELLDSPSLPPSCITKLLSNIGLHVSAGQRDSLVSKVEDLIPESGSEKRMVDFACFLQLMRWMLDTDFANINGTTKKTVDKMRMHA